MSDDTNIWKATNEWYRLSVLGEIPEWDDKIVSESFELVSEVNVVGRCMEQVIYKEDALNLPDWSDDGSDDGYPYAYIGTLPMTHYEDMIQIDSTLKEYMELLVVLRAFFYIDQLTSQRL